jgi:hypothetical protein
MSCSGPKRGRVVTPDERAKLFRQDIADEFKRLRWARSATKQRMAKAPRLVFLGEDSAGVSLEVIAVRTNRANLMVIHAMNLRPRYRPLYEEVRRWDR